MGSEELEDSLGPGDLGLLVVGNLVGRGIRIIVAVGRRAVQLTSVKKNGLLLSFELTLIVFVQGFDHRRGWCRG